MWSHLLAGIWFIMWGLTAAAVTAIDSKFLGIWAIITGIVYLVELFASLPAFPVHRG